MTKEVLDLKFTSAHIVELRLAGFSKLPLFI